MSDGVPSAPHTIGDFIRGYEEHHILKGFRCTRCGTVSATWGLACARCGNADREEVRLSETGRVVAYTILTVPGDDFLNDAPYAYVVVELDGGGRVTGWMPTVKQDGEVAIGDRVRFVPGYKPGVQFAKESDAAASG